MWETLALLVSGGLTKNIQQLSVTSVRMKIFLSNFLELVNFCFLKCLCIRVMMIGYMIVMIKMLLEQSWFSASSRYLMVVWPRPGSQSDRWLVWWWSWLWRSWWAGRRMQLSLYWSPLIRPLNWIPGWPPYLPSFLRQLLSTTQSFTSSWTNR